MRTDKNMRDKRKAENLCNWGAKRYFSVGNVNVAKTDKMGGRILLLQFPNQPVQFLVLISPSNPEIFLCGSQLRIRLRQSANTGSRQKLTSVVNFS